VNAVRAVSGAETDHRHRQNLRQIFGNFRRGHFAKNGKASGVDHRLGVVDHILGPLSGLTLRYKATQLWHAHWR